MRNRRVQSNGAEIAPSILAADFTRLGEQIAELKAAGCRLLHVDVMDGHFVPNISIGVPVVQALRQAGPPPPPPARPPPPPPPPRLPFTDPGAGGVRGGLRRGRRRHEQRPPGRRA